MDIKPFERIRAGPAARDMREVGVVLRFDLKGREMVDSLRPKREIGFSIGGNGDAGEKVAGLEAENKRLKASLERAVQVNDKMWAGVVQLKLADGA